MHVIWIVTLICCDVSLARSHSISECYILKTTTNSLNAFPYFVDDDGQAHIECWFRIFQNKTKPIFITLWKAWKIIRTIVTKYGYFISNSKSDCKPIQWPSLCKIVKTFRNTMLLMKRMCLLSSTSTLSSITSLKYIFCCCKYPHHNAAELKI